MKKLYLLTLIVLLQTTVYAQPYLSIFGDASTSWNIAKEIPDATLTDSLYTGSDTSFNGHNYTRVHRYTSVDGFIREDTASGKVWYYSKYESEEFLIMDLSLSVGDTFYLVTSPWLQDSVAVVDTVYTDDLGKKHVVLDYKFYFFKEEPLAFIEGVGPNAGITHQSRMKLWNGLNSVLLCSFKDGNHHYTNTLLTGTQYEGDCSITWTGIEERKQSPSWKLYPNPFYDYTILSFENEQALNCTLEIYNLQGQVVQSKQNITTEEIRIEKDKLNKGTYFFRLYSDSKVIASGKMLVGR